MGRNVLAQGCAILIFVTIGPVIPGVLESSAQSGRTSIRANTGFGLTFLSDFTAFLREPSHLDAERLASFLSLDVVYDLTDHHSLVLSLEWIRSSTFTRNAVVHYPQPSETLGFYAIDYGFQAIPVNLSYEFRPTRSKQSASPFLGVGMSYFFSKVNYRTTQTYDPFLPWLVSEEERRGNGYGIHAHAGLDSWITQHLYILARIRARYADGLAFSRSETDLKVDFSGVDIAFGLGYTF